MEPAMFRLTIKSLWANKVRFALTTFGVMLAVSFVVAAFVLGDGLRSTLHRRLRGDHRRRRSRGPQRSRTSVTRHPAGHHGATVAAVDGVADAVASIEAADNAVRPIGANGDVIPTDGPPQLAFNWIDNDELSAFTLVDGARPRSGSSRWTSIRRQVRLRHR
jgi:hypothetical protein